MMVLLTIVKQSSNKKLNVLHCPTFSAGNASGLSRAERKLGLSSYSFSIESSIYNFDIDYSLNPFKHRILALIFREFLRWPMLLFALVWADVVHYNFGQTLMPQWYGNKQHKKDKYIINIAFKFLKIYTLVLEHFDVKLLKWFGKKIIVTYQGDDARQGDYCRKHYSLSAANYVNESYYSVESDNNKRRLIGNLEKYTDKIYALNPDLLNVLPQNASFLPYASVDLNDLSFLETAINVKPMVIHAPTHRDVKGTEFIIEAVQRLITEGYDFEFKLIEGLSHDEAIILYKKADILIDQLLVGWYGGLSLELMALGKPVICYLRNEDLKYLPKKMRKELPIINANPDTIYEVLRSTLCQPPEFLRKQGVLCRRYVEKWHDPLVIAKSLKHYYESN